MNSDPRVSPEDAQGLLDTSTSRCPSAQTAHKCRKFCVRYRNQVLGRRKGAARDVRPVLPECRDAFPLQARHLAAEVAIHLRVTRQVVASLAEHILGKQVLRITATTRPHGPQ